VTHTAIYAGVRLPGYQAIAWSLRVGTQPYQTNVEVSQRVAEQLEPRLGLSSELQLGPKVFKGVFLLAIEPGSSPERRRLLLADSRWLLKRQHVSQAFNLRHKVGEYHPVGDRIEVAVLDPDVEYKRFTLRFNRIPYKVSEVVDEVLGDRVPTGLNAVTGASDPEVEELYIDGAGDVALAQALLYYHGVEPVVWDDGLLHLIYVLNKQEEGILNRLRPHFNVSDVPQRVELQHLRPRRVGVLFTREVEIRFDYLENDTSSAVENRRDPTLINVLKVPDAELSLTDGTKVGYGTWLKVDDAIAAWNLTTRPSAAPELSQRLLRQHATSSFRALRIRYTTADEGEKDSIWVARFDALHRHWRKTFQPIKEWRDRLLAIRANRVAVVNPSTGARAEAAVYTDYIVKPTWRGLGLDKRSSRRVDHGYQIEGYATKLSDATLGPFDVTVLDPQAFVFSVIGRVDPWGEASEVFPGLVGEVRNESGDTVGGDLPAINPGAFNREKEAFVALWERIALKDGWQLAVVLSAVPITPNSVKRLHKHTITPEEAVVDVGGGSGPTKNVRVYPRRMTARFAWSDDHKDAFLNAIFDTGFLPLELLVNRKHVRAMAKAEATIEWLSLLDRFTVNHMVVSGNEVINPVGAIKEVRTMLDTNGHLTTQLLVGLPVVARDSTHLLPAATRRYLLGSPNADGDV